MPVSYVINDDICTMWREDDITFLSTAEQLPVLWQHPQELTNNYIIMSELFDMMTSSNRNISALLAICTGNSPVTGEFPAQRPVTRSFDVFFDLRLE